MDNEQKRKFTKFIVTTVIRGVSGGVITKTLEAVFPASENLNLSDITGLIGGYYIGVKTKPHTDQMVDDIFDKREAKKSEQTD